MVTVVKYGEDKKKIRSLLDRLKNQKSRIGIDAYKYCGVFTLAEEPLLIQKKSLEMNGDKVFVDTNIILYLFAGDKTIAELLNGKQIYISFITQLELLSYSKNTKKDLKIINDLIDQCVIIDINDEIKEMVVDLKRKYRFKLPDGIIIATAIYLDLPLITADQEFKKAEQLNLIFYER